MAKSALGWFDSRFIDGTHAPIMQHLEGEYGSESS